MLPVHPEPLSAVLSEGDQVGMSGLRQRGPLPLFFGPKCHNVTALGRLKEPRQGPEDQAVTYVRKHSLMAPRPKG